ncbi:unnamed protein product, partial [Prorocentrum cordatum]
TTVLDVADAFPVGPSVELALPFHGEDGEERYFTVRGLASVGPHMPFGGRVDIAEGYVVDVTGPELALKEASRWQERWQGLARLVFDFVLLVDTTQYRILEVWDDSGVFDEKLDGRSLLNYLEGPEDRSAMSSAISTALLAEAGAQRPVAFWNSRRK